MTPDTKRQPRFHSDGGKPRRVGYRGDVASRPLETPPFNSPPAIEPGYRRALTRAQRPRAPVLLALACLACTNTDDSEPRDTGPAGDALRVPAEWEPQAAIWLQWPQRWEASYEPAFARIVATILRHEAVHILVNDASTRRSAEEALEVEGGLSAAVIGGAASSQGFRITWHDIPNDNAWMRDNGPTWVVQDGEVRIQDWGFDAWGGAFGAGIPYEADDAVPVAVGAALDVPVDGVDIVHERGNLEFNGSDGVILNWSTIGDAGRNPGITREDVERAMRRHFGVSRVVIVEGAPEGDLTGGHIDGIARFIDEERVVVADCSKSSRCEPGGHDDQIYDDAAEQIAAQGFEVVRWPFLGAVAYRDTTFDTDYMNWLVGNGFVATVGFDNPATDSAAKAQIEAWFPGREVYIIETLESWYAGGGVHCHTNDQPAG
ncbi:MAG: agmatine deiminase family protein [Deltaproteobacteria bacterium]|nr:agmatine deiminase family protein [Deltaproteobacteria bacterium]